MPLLNLLIYITSFIAIWLGSGLIISSMDRFSKKLRLSSFATSFIILGLLTSTPEFAVGLTSVANKDSEIFVGNLLGGIPVIFLFIIPLLAVFGNGISLHHKLEGKNLIATLIAIAAPSILILDKNVSSFEGVIMIVLYLFVLLLIEKKHGIFDRKNTDVFNIKAYSYKDVIKVLLGIGIVFVSSQVVVEKTIYFSHLLHVPLFLISLMVLSLGTNLPELSLAMRSLLSGKKEVALGDYMGSASANTLLFGIFTLLNNGEVLVTNNFLFTFVFIILSLGLFYFFTHGKDKISRKEGLILLSLYVIFVFLEFVK